MPSWVQHPVTGEFILKEEYGGYESSAPCVHGSIEPIVSPIDGSVIGDRKRLREHNLRHGVTCTDDYSPEYIAKRAKLRDDTMTGNTPQARRERVDLIKKTLHDFGVR
jgi:hypothetical protein